MLLRRTLLALLLGTVLAQAGTVRADVVTLVPNSTVKATGGQVRGTILAETPNEVRVRTTAGAEQAVPIDQIESIDYDASPPSLALAEARAAAGSLTEAIDLYKKATTEAAGKPFIVQAVRFAQARAMAQLGAGTPAKAAEAVAALEAFHKEFPQSRHRGPALELLARLALQGGEPDKAVASLAELEKLAWARDRAAVLRTEVLSARGQHAQAIAALDQILGTAPKGSAKARDARLAKAKALAATQKFAEAEALVREVIKEALPEDAAIQAVAHNTLGDCLRAASRPKDALFAYLQTDILYDRDKDQHARALGEIARLWRVLKRDDRADEVMERLKQQYPQSPYLSANASGR